MNKALYWIRRSGVGYGIRINTNKIFNFVFRGYCLTKRCFR